MKKIWIIALFMALIMVAGVFAQNQNWYITNSEGGSAARNNQVTLRPGENFVYIYFRDGLPGANFNSLRINFTISRPLNMLWQCAYYADMQGGVLGATEYIGELDSGPVETNFASFTQVWSGPRNVTAQDKSKLTGVVLAIPVERGTGNATFTMTSVEFIGLQN